MPSVRFDNPPMKTASPLALACLLAPGCVFGGHDRPVVFATDPPGARVLVAGKDSGFVTPCVLDLDPSEDTRVDLDLAGYRRETRFLTPDHEVYAILWKEMYSQPTVWRFPLWLNLQDTWVPVKHVDTLSPGRVFVRLDRSADEKSAPPGATKAR